MTIWHGKTGHSPNVTCGECTPADVGAVHADWASAGERSMRAMEARSPASETAPGRADSAYDVGYREGGNSAHADWELALSEVLGDDFDITPESIAAILRPWEA